MASVAAQLGLVPTANVVYVARNCQVASSVAVLYDHVITFDREVDHVWDHPSSFGSIHYMLVRYLGDALAIINILGSVRRRDRPNFAIVRFSPITFQDAFTDAWMSMTLHSCKVYFFAQSWLGILVLFLIQLMLQVRLYALYRGSRIILAVMTFGYMCEIAATSVTIGLVDADSLVTNEILPGMRICADERGPAFYQPYLFWLPIIAYEGVLCLLAMWRAVGRWRSGYRVGRSVGACIQDGLVTGNVSYFLCLILACVVSIITGRRLGLRWTEVTEGYPAAMEAIIGCRLILNLRTLLVRSTHSKDGGGECEGIVTDAPWVVRRPLSTHAFGVSVSVGIGGRGEGEVITSDTPWIMRRPLSMHAYGARPSVGV